MSESGREKSWSNINEAFADVHMHDDEESHAEPR